MRILAIETSCDETSAAIVEDGTKVISNIIASSLPLHARTGGIIPEVAARQQIEYIIPVIEKVIKNEKIDAIAVTIGPGLIGSLLIGVETAKTLAFAWNKPIIPVNHLLGHIYANFIINESNPTPYHLPPFPFIGLIVSGGHTDLLLFKSHTNYKWLGGTRDDAAGEALDKIARILGLSYPGGPEIEKRAKNGNPKAFNFPRPMIDSENFDFSFSGLKTAILREVQKYNLVSINSHPELVLGSRFAKSSLEVLNQVQHDRKLDEQTINNTCASVQQAIVDVLIKKTARAAKMFNVANIVIGGGVSANQSLKDKFEIETKKISCKLFFPEKKFTTDNAAMIGATAFFQHKEVPWSKITANPELYFD